MRLIAPSGAEVEAREDAVKGLLAMGFKRQAAAEQEERPKKKPAAKGKAQ